MASAVTIESSVSPARLLARAPSGSPERAHAGRLARLREAARAKDLTHLLVTDPRDVGYLTGFLGGDSYLLVPADESVFPILISDFRYEEELAGFKTLARIVIRKSTMLPCVVETFAAERVERCGIQGEHMTVAERDTLADRMDKAIGDPGRPGHGVLVPTRGILTAMRSVKDDHEVALIRHAVRIQQDALLALRPTISPGQTELEIAARLESEMKSRGSVEPAFTSIVAARANGSLPHHRPGATRAAFRQPLLIDWGAKWLGYCSDMTRTFHLGPWSATMRDVYRIVLDAHILAADSLRAGVTTAEIDRIAREHISRHGHGERFGHGLGHGIGINVHEEPRLTQQVDPVALAAGNVLTIEPGIYLPGVGGVRIENDYLVTPTGAECLCTLPMDLEWSVLG
ncbi:MAG: aminopeptidase P family protein [Phycisphaerae bacterium]|nr:aminopeptidase P family protein [Phycisphaerae bacterium]